MADDNELGGFGLNDMTPPQLTVEYLNWRQAYRDLIKRAVRISRGSGGILVDGNRLAYASVLFVRISVTAKSIEQLLADCKPREHWDFAAVASLTRNLSEVYLWYYWLCEEEVEVEERRARFILLYCHDNGSRARLFANNKFGEQRGEVLADLATQFDGNAYLKRYDEKSRREALKGYKTPFVQDDILMSMGEDKDNFRFFYRFFSQYTHNGPVAFFRMIEHDRGKGVETAHEKSYIILALIFAYSLLQRAIEGHLSLFPDAETRKPHLTETEIIRNVERNQGRQKMSRRR